MPALGAGSHDASTLEILSIAIPLDDLSGPRDLAFNPSDEVSDELWVVCANNEVVIFSRAGQTGQTSRTVSDPWASHAMADPMGIAFGSESLEGSDFPTFATCQGATPADGLMGPSVWSSDEDVFGLSNPEAVKVLTDLYGEPTDHGSYLDMLHESPGCVGIGHQYTNVYWVFDGQDGALVRYDFGDVGPPGFDDATDGVIERYVSGELSAVAGLPSGVVYDSRNNLVFVADSGNNAIKALSTLTGKPGESLPSSDGASHVRVEGAELATLVQGEDHGIELPAGLDIYDDFLVVGDHATGILYAFTINGELLDYVDTGLGPNSLMGVEIVDKDEIWVVDGANDQVVRITPVE